MEKVMDRLLTAFHDKLVVARKATACWRIGTYKALADIATKESLKSDKIRTYDFFCNDPVRITYETFKGIISDDEKKTWSIWIEQMDA